MEKEAHAFTPTGTIASLHPEQLALFVGAVRDYAIFALDPHGRITSWNAGAEGINGFTAPEVIGRHFSLFYPPEDVADGKPERELEIAAREGQYEEEGWRLRKGGERYLAHVLITASRDTQGRLVGFTKVTHDVTERASADQALRESLAELARANAALAARNEEQEHFIHAISHDLRAPLLSVSGMSELLGEAIAAGEQEEAGFLLARVSANVERAQRLLNDLLAFLKAGRRSAPIEDIDLGDKVRNVLNDLEPAVRARGVQVELPKHWPVLRFARSELYEVMANLLGNAVKFAGRPGERPRVRLEWQEDEESLTVTISDNGAGVPVEKRESVFGLFNRLDPSKEGTGLGLSIVRRIVEARGGQVSITEGPLGGASFVVVFPKAD